MIKDLYDAHIESINSLAEKSDKQLIGYILYLKEKKEKNEDDKVEYQQYSDLVIIAQDKLIGLYSDKLLRIKQLSI